MVAYKSNRENRIRVEVGDIFIPKHFDAWMDSTIMILSTTRPGPTVMRFGGKHSGEILILTFEYMQRSHWVKRYNRF